MRSPGCSCSPWPRASTTTGCVRSRRSCSSGHWHCVSQCSSLHPRSTAPTAGSWSGRSACSLPRSQRSRSASGPARSSPAVPHRARWVSCVKPLCSRRRPVLDPHPARAGPRDDDLSLHHGGRHPCRLRCAVPSSRARRLVGGRARCGGHLHGALPPCPLLQLHRPVAGSTGGRLPDGAGDHRHGLGRASPAKGSARGSRRSSICPRPTPT